jgi:hypothetical protein
VYVLISPPINGPVDGPMNGASAKTAMGASIVSRVNKSPTVPPETDRNALPARPWKKRAMIMVSMFLATADGMSQMMKPANEAR